MLAAILSDILVTFSRNIKESEIAHNKHKPKGNQKFKIRRNQIVLLNERYILLHIREKNYSHELRNYWSSSILPEVKKPSVSGIESGIEFK